MQERTTTTATTMFPHAPAKKARWSKDDLLSLDATRRDTTGGGTRHFHRFEVKRGVSSTEHQIRRLQNEDRIPHVEGMREAKHREEWHPDEKSALLATVANLKSGGQCFPKDGWITVAHEVRKANRICRTIPACEHQWKKITNETPEEGEDKDCVGGDANIEAATGSRQQKCPNVCSPENPFSSRDIARIVRRTESKGTDQVEFGFPGAVQHGDNFIVSPSSCGIGLQDFRNKRLLVQWINQRLQVLRVPNHSRPTISKLKMTNVQFDRLKKIFFLGSSLNVPLEEFSDIEYISFSNNGDRRLQLKIAPTGFIHQMLLENALQWLVPMSSPSGNFQFALVLFGTKMQKMHTDVPRCNFVCSPRGMPGELAPGEVFERNRHECNTVMARPDAPCSILLDLSHKRSMRLAVPECMIRQSTEAGLGSNSHCEEIEIAGGKPGERFMVTN